MRWRADAGRALVVLTAALAGGPAGASLTGDLALPETAVQTYAQDAPFGRYAAPIDVFGEDGWLKPVTGAVTRRAWRLPADADSLTVARTVEAALSAAGYETRLRCAQAECGGLGFRSAIWLAPFPHMRVSVGDFHQLTMQRADTLLSTLVSRAGDAVFVQSVSVSEARADPVIVTPTALPAAVTPEQPRPSGAEADRAAAPSAPPSDAPPRNAGPNSVGAALDGAGHAVLEGVDFEPGSLTFTRGAAQGLDAAAAALAARPGLSVAVVGHTDGVGALAANERVGALRAEAVLEALVARGVDPARLQAHSAAWLAPRASNQTAPGRARNRRVVLVARSDP